MKRLFFAAVLSILACTTGHASAQRPLANTELFIEIAERGTFTVSVDNEVVQSDFGRFRFFQTNRTPLIIIKRGNTPLIERRLTLSPGKRTIMSYRSANFRMERELDILYQGQYALDNWDQRLYNGDGPTTPGSPRRLSADGLTALVDAMRREGFDAERAKVARAGISNQFLATEQLQAILSAFSFSEQRLPIIKYAYPRLIDPQNAYRLKDQMVYIGEKDELMKFLDSAAK